MLNLLPKDQKKAIVREYRIRFWVIFCSLFLAVEIISLILLVPPYIIAQTRMYILNNQSISPKVQDLNSESASLSAIIKKTNDYVNIINSTSTPIGVVKAIENIIEVRDKSIRIDRFFYKINNGNQQVDILGKADSRQSLLDFVKKIKGQKGVVSADLPVSDFAKPEDIDFSIKILMTPQNI